MAGQLLASELAALWDCLGELNKLVLLAVSIMHVTLGTAYYFSAVKPQYIGLLQAHRQQPVFDRNHLPRRPLWSLAGSSTAALALTTSIYALVMHFGIDSWRQGLHMAAVLLVIDSALNARHHFCEGRPLGLFLLHAGYHALVLAMCCCALAEFGRPNAAGGGGSGSGGGPAATARAKHEL